MARSLTEMTVDILTAQLSHRDMSADEIVDVLNNTFCALRALKDMETRRELQGSEAEAPVTPAESKTLPLSELVRSESEEEQTPKASTEMRPMDSIQQDRIICLECGQRFRQISHTHLSIHGLTPREYRKKYRLLAKQPLTARSLTEKRKQRAKETGLGEKLKILREAKRRSG